MTLKLFLYVAILMSVIGFAVLLYTARRFHEAKRDQALRESKGVF